MGTTALVAMKQAGSFSVGVHEDLTDLCRVYEVRVSEVGTSEGSETPRVKQYIRIPAISRADSLEMAEKIAEALEMHSA